MRAIVFDTPDSPLELREVPDVPAPGPTEVRIRTHYSGVNRADLAQRAGRYPAPPGASPLLGLEVCGKVLEIGRDVRRFRVGQPVMALLAGGGYAEQVVVPEELCLPVPAPLDLEKAGAVPEAFLTAHLNLFLVGELREGEVALIHAGASGVGTAAIQLARLAGAQVFATVGSEDKARAVESLGAIAIDRKKEDFAERVKQEARGNGCDFILDVAGGDTLEKNTEILRLDGRLVCIGLLGARKGTLDVGRLLMKRQRVIGSTLRSLPLDRKRALVADFERRWMPALADGRLKPVVDRTFDAAAAEEAHRYMRSDKNIGKILLRWHEGS
jgi:putative PIG3 family NAD(P)H quinone oxidoreductase